MSMRIEDWLSRMVEARNPGPAVRVIGLRGGRESPWMYEIHEESLGELADRIEQQIHDEVALQYELRAVDQAGQVVGTMHHRADAMAQVLPPPGPPVAVEATVQQALRSSRAFAVLGLRAVAEGQEIAKSMIRRLEKENIALSAENAELRKKLSDQWELADKLSSHQLDKQIEADRASRQGRLAEILVSAAMTRLVGRSTPEGQGIEHQMAMSLLRSIGPEQAQKILPILTDDQRLALMELLREEQAKAAAENGAPQTAHDAAAAAAMVNGKAH